MPEIKNNFIRGKMNKDLDERLVPKGEYVHAENIQVSSSDGSEDTQDAGTIQNIMGNLDATKYLSGGTYSSFTLPSGSKCIGAISDEKDNTLYWFITSPTCDGIIRRKISETNPTVFPYGDCQWVFVDSNKDTLKFTDKIITGVNIIDDLLFWTDGINEPRKINITRCLEQTVQSFQNQTQIATESGNVDIREEHITVIKKSPSNPLALDLKTFRIENQIAEDSGVQLSYTAVTIVADPGSQLPNNIVEIIPANDPASPLVNVNDFSSISIGDKIKIELLQDIHGNDDYELEWVKGVVGGGGSNTVGAQWVGQKIVLKEFSLSGNAPSLPITDHRIKGVLTNYFNPDNPSLISNSSLQNGNDDAGKIIVEFEVTHINGSPALAEQDSTLRYAVDLFDESEKLFEFKFPRFSYRYRYDDNEYSAFGPWTEVAFAPGSFDYHPKKGYNIGMTNRLSSCVIKNFITDDIPLDVKEIEILYKEEGSATVYAVDAIKKDGKKYINIDGTDYNHWDLNYYEVKDETINKILPENQFIRPWDNVPINALAQEVTGNRIVYGNYTQGHDVKVNTWKDGPFVASYKPVIETSIVSLSASESTTGLNAVKSIKSLREYQLGVLFVDKYGRETPILTSPVSTFKLEKDKAATANRLKVSLENASEPFTDNSLLYYKFFIKETSGEYYNLAMDRFYDAGDGNKWLSFPSSDRNKIDIDTFLILKKAQESNFLITDPARYKILAVENEAPDFIKIDRRLIASAIHIEGSDEIFYSGINSNPIFGEQSLTLKYQVFANSSGSLLHDIEDGELWLEFGLVASSQKSKRYRVSEITKTGAGGSENFNITLSDPLGHDVDFIANDPTLQNVTGIATNTTIRFFHYKVENKAKFDGRFFVKIFGDDVFKKSFESESVSTTTLYRVVDERKQYSIFPNHNDLHDSDQTGQNYGTDGYVAGLGKWAPYYRNYNKKDSDYCWFDVSQGGTAGAACDDPNSPRVGRFAFEHASWPQGLSDYAGGCGPDGFDPNAEMELYPQMKYPGWWQEALRQTLHEDSSNVNSTNQPEWFIYQHKGTNLALGATGSGGSTNPGEWDYHRHIPNEVWAIDGGPFDGKKSGNNLAWPIDSTTAGVNSGITTWGNEWRMQIAFGPVAPSNHLPYSATGNSTNNYWGRDDQLDFWNIGTEIDSNTQYTDQSTRNWVQNYNVGRQFRWEDDPDQTIYTIKSKSEWGTANYDRTRDTGYDPIFSLSINKRKNWEMHMEPAPNWIPYDGTFGPIDNGHQIDINAELGPNSTTSDNSTVGVLEDYCIYLETNFATCNNTGQQATIIKPGMIVTQYNNGGSALTHVSINDATPALQVKEVDVQSNYTKVILCGYVNALNASHCITPTDGQLVRFEQAKCNGYSTNSANRISLNKSNDESPDLLRAVGYNMQFVETTEFESTLPDNPAIWETEPKEETGLDIYYEISGYNPWVLDAQTAITAIPIGSTVELVNTTGSLTPCQIVSIDYTYFNSSNQQEYLVVELSEQTSGLNGFPSANSKLKITRPDGVSFEVYVAFDVSSTWGDTTSDGDGNFGSSANWEYLVALSRSTPKNYTLNFHNCYSFLNGVESNRIRDNFNLPFITNGVKVSTIFEDEILQEKRSSGLIYSGIYNSITGINNLNQFIQAEKITKDINPIYGSIQKLHSRDTDLVTFCEDKVLKILANKDAVFNADGKPQLTANINVLGQAIPFIGEYGISKNPESFASESYRAYFSDKTRGAVIRLSKDGLTPISNHGMTKFFRDNLKLSHAIIGSYDDYKDEYNITLKKESDSKVVTFREDVKGWVSFKSFADMEYGISNNNYYYTFKDGKLWKHHGGDGSYNANNFYGLGSKESKVEFIFNDFPEVVKSFNSINYQGSESKIDQIGAGVPSVLDLFGIPILPPSGNGWIDSEYYNEAARDGWYVDVLTTDLEEGSVNEFIKKEGKYFNHIKGKKPDINESNVAVGFDPSSINIQGLGRITSSSEAQFILGCTDFTAFNYDSTAVLDDGSCVPVVTGCVDSNAYNHIPGSNTDDGSCLYAGCTDDGVVSLEILTYGYVMWDTPNDNSPFPGIPANNQDFNANVACGSDPSTPHANNSEYNACCTYTLIGCTDPTAFNYDSIANTQCNADASAAGNNECCIQVITGCMDPNASNHDATANTENGSCEYPGCIDSNASTYIVPNPNQISEGDGWHDLTTYTGSPHGDILALAGLPSYIGNNYGILDNPFIGTNYGCPDWSFAPNIFGNTGQNPPPAGVGVLIPRMAENGYCSSVPYVTGDWQQYVGNSNPANNIGCDPTIPYQSVIYVGTNVNVGGSAFDPGPFGNNPPNTPDTFGGVLPTWPDISYALDVNGNQIPFTHQWWNAFGDYIPLQHMVNPFPPCATVDDGSCDYLGCDDPSAANYDSLTTIADNSTCLYCGDDVSSGVMNYDGALDAASQLYYEGCIYCPGDTNINNVVTNTTYSAGSFDSWDFNPTGSQIDISFDLSLSPPGGGGSYFNPLNYPTEITSGSDNFIGIWYRITGNSGWTFHGYAPNTSSSNSYSASDLLTGLTPDTAYDIKIVIYCPQVANAGLINQTMDIIHYNLQSITTAPGPVTGCGDPVAINYCSTCTVLDSSLCNYTGCTISSDDNGDEDMNYQGATIPCQDINAYNYLGQSTTWDTNIQEIAQTHPNYPNNWSAPINMWIMEDGPFYNLPNNCCAFTSDSAELVFGGLNGEAGYYGCMDSEASNYCPSCVYDIQAETGVVFCEYSGCNALNAGVYSDVNGYCSDAVYDHVAQTYTSSGTVTTTVTDPEDASLTINGCVDGFGADIGFLAQNHDPRVNNHNTSTINCVFAGCGAPGCQIGYNWGPEQPTGVNACEFTAYDPNFRSSQDFGYPTDMGGTAAPGNLAENITVDGVAHGLGPGYLMGLNNFNHDPEGLAHNNNETGSNAGFWVGGLNLYWGQYNHAVMCYSSTACLTYREACNFHLNTEGDSCIDACYRSSGYPETDGSRGWQNNGGNANAYHVQFNYEPVGCTSGTGPQKSAKTGLDFMGPYYKFEYTLGEKWCTDQIYENVSTSSDYCNAGHNPMPTSFTHTDVIPLSEMQAGLGTLDTYHSALWLSITKMNGSGNFHFDGNGVSLPDIDGLSGIPRWWARSYPPANTAAFGTTVKVGIYKMCQNGTEIRIDRGWQQINADTIDHNGLTW